MITKPTHEGRFPFACVLLALLAVAAVASCGRSKTTNLLLDKQWMVTDVTPPSGTFNVEQSNRAQDLKAGFYKGAWFKFMPDSIFVASLGGRTDTGRYHINATGDVISLYPAGGGRMYEQLQIQRLTLNQFVFTTVIADFHLVLHLSTENGIQQP